MATRPALGRYSLPERLHAAVDDFGITLTVYQFVGVSWVSVCDIAKFPSVDWILEISGLVRDAETTPNGLRLRPWFCGCAVLCGNLTVNVDRAG